MKIKENIQDEIDNPKISPEIEEDTLIGESLEDYVDDNNNDLINEIRDEQVLENRMEQAEEIIIDEDKKRKKKESLLVALTIVIIVISIVGIFSTVFALLNYKNDKIQNNISIEGFDVSDITPEEAKVALNRIVEEKLKSGIIIKSEGYETEISPESLELKYDVDRAVQEAFNYGRQDNTIVNNYKSLMLKFKNINLDMTYSINEDEVNNIIGKIENEINGSVVQYSYFIEKDTNKLVVTRGKEGLGVNKDIFKDRLNTALSDLVEKTNYIEIPTITKKPEQIDVDKIYSEVHKEPKDATYIKEPFSLEPEVNGVDFDKEALKTLINSENKDEYSIDLKITKPKVTVYSIGAEAFPNVISTFSTNYDASNSDRTTNLRLAAGKINGTVIMPGEEFSYNKVVGERTIAAGYKDAKIYSNGEVVDGLGGGICQISSTLYNTALLSNLKITSRRNHQFVTSYLPAGRDATVVWGSQDFKFVNTRKYPIKIFTSVSGGVATVTFKGLKEDTEYDISFQSATISTIPVTTKYQDDNTLAEGTEKVKQKGATGKIVETYKLMSLNGQVVSKTLISRDTYNAMQKIVIRGTKKSVQSSPVTQSPTPTTDNSENVNNNVPVEEKTNVTIPN